MSIAETVVVEFAAARERRIKRLYQQDQAAIMAGKPRVRRRRKNKTATLNMNRMSKREIEIGERVYPKEEHPHVMADGPKTRGECNEKRRDGSGLRSFCPYVGCKNHLYLDVKPGGSITLNYPDLEVWEMKETCALDIADSGVSTLEDVAEHMQVTKERARQLEEIALMKVAHLLTKVRDEDKREKRAKFRLTVIK